MQSGREVELVAPGGISFSIPPNAGGPAAAPERDPYIQVEWSDGDVVLTRLVEPLCWISFAIGVAAAIFYGRFLGDFSFLIFLAGIIAVSVVVWAATDEPAKNRFLLAIFLGAFGLRLLSSILFHNVNRIGGDAFSGSPDAWKYDHWANQVVEYWLHGDFPSLSNFYLAGTWDVGFYYILGGTYLLFGGSTLVGRLLVVLFGALAALVFCVLARDLAGRRAGTWAGVVYAFWPVSILWTGYSIVRDPLVWFLILLSVLLVLRVITGRGPLATTSLLVTLVVLRFVRSYAAFLVVLGLGIAAVWWLLHFDRRFLRVALTLGAVVIAAEGIVGAAGAPSALQTARIYEVIASRYAMRALPTTPASSKTAQAPRSGLRPRIGKHRGLPTTSWTSTSFSARAPTSSPATPGPLTPEHLTSPGPITNSVRFFFGPFAWTPDVASDENWQLPAMWFWYVILPAAIAGLLLGLRERPALRVVLLTSLLFSIVLVVAGRGDSFRQREMIMPIFLLAFAVCIDIGRRYWRPLLLLYVVYLIALAGLIVYHRHTLSQRGLIARLEQPSTQSPLRNASRLE